MSIFTRAKRDQRIQQSPIIVPATLDCDHPDEFQPSAWSLSCSKRFSDIVLASLALLLTAPFLLLASLLVFTSRGPLLFVSARVGKGGKNIRVLKFRTMRHRGETGRLLTRGNDERITPAGHWLRKWKLDELPQFLNVLLGEMSMVGPRPDSREFINTLPAFVKSTLFRLRPGITSVASLKFRDEASVLAHVPEPELSSYYNHLLLPHKVFLDLDYASRATFLSDLRLLVRTAAELLK
jgi:lipopolysaccharide/colanic/teichoic acid biosynthesis glycosyltransferase